ncbi:MAG: hypothetical protein IKD81_00320, partial [Eubacteriaceae bacterium]|nr:hypothetical protein [Eubacteriaceae bacterium]
MRLFTALFTERITDFSEKKTLQQKIHARKLKKAPKWLFTILTPVMKILNRKVNYPRLRLKLRGG